MPEAIVRLLSAAYSLNGDAITGCFALTLAALAFHLGLAARTSPRVSARSARRGLGRHAGPLLALLAAAIALRRAFSPMYLQTGGLDYWLINDGLRAVHQRLMTEAPRSPAHACVMGLFLALVGFRLPALFLVNFALGVAYVLCSYVLIFLLSESVPAAFCGSLVVAFLPAGIAASGGVLDSALSGVLLLCFLIAFQALRRNPGKELFYAASLAAAAAAQARPEGFIVLILYAALVALHRRRFQPIFKTSRVLVLGCFYACLSLPHVVQQLASYGLMLARVSSSPSQAGPGGQGPFLTAKTLLDHGLIWLYDRQNLTAALYAVIAAALVLCVLTKVKNPLRGTSPLWLYLVLYLAVYAPMSRYGFMAWYPLTGATVVVMLLMVALNGLPRARLAALLLAALPLCADYGMTDFETASRPGNSERTTRIVEFTQREFARLGSDRFIFVYGLEPAAENFFALSFRDRSFTYRESRPGTITRYDERSFGLEGMREMLAQGIRVFYLPNLAGDEHRALSDDLRARGLALNAAYALRGGERWTYDILEVAAAGRPAAPVKTVLFD